MIKMIDLVLGGPDMSGTSTQVKDLVDNLRDRGMKIRDLRGNDNDTLFHAEVFSQYNEGYERRRDFLFDLDQHENATNTFRLILQDCELTNKVASCVRNDLDEYVNPNSADVWIMEEPPNRNGGQVCRVIEQRRSQYRPEGIDYQGKKFSNLFKINPIAAALAHQSYRTGEFMQFRGPLRDASKIIIRSRSEESACYQVFDKDLLPDGIGIEDYLSLPGHKVAFSKPPTDIFVACAHQGWTEKEYLELKRERSGDRTLDDHETNAAYQVMVNERYATDWIDNLYARGCEMYNSIPPEITRFNLYDSPKVIKEQMTAKLDEIMRG